MENTTSLSEPEQDCLEQCRKMEAECRSLWIRALEFSPKLANYCPHWHDFTPMEWADLVAHNSNFINIAPLHKFGAAEWYIVLNRQPQLIEKCPLIADFPENYWKNLVKDYPWFNEYRARVCSC